MSRHREGLGVTAVVGLVLGLSGCATEQDRREAAAVTPHLNVLAAKIAELPHVHLRHRAASLTAARATQIPVAVAQVQSVLR